MKVCVDCTLDLAKHPKKQFFLFSIHACIKIFCCCVNDESLKHCSYGTQNTKTQCWNHSYLLRHDLVKLHANSDVISGWRLIARVGGLRFLRWGCSILRVVSITESAHKPEILCWFSIVTPTHYLYLYNLKFDTFDWYKGYKSCFYFYHECCKKFF